MNTIVRFGDVDITGGVIGWQATSEKDPVRGGLLSLTSGALSHGVDFAATVQVLNAAVTPAQPLFTGVVWSATRRDDGGLDLELRTGSQPLREQRIGGLIFGANMSPQERIYSLLHVSGIKPEAMSLQGLALPVPNPFEISTTVSGLRVSSPFAVGETTFVCDGPISKVVDDLLGTPAADTTMLDGRRLVDTYRSASCWAWTTVQTSSLDVAEELGLLNLRHALSLVKLHARFSFSCAPGEAEREYRREAAVLSRPALGNVVHVRALRSSHRWLRCIDGFTEDHPLDVDALDLRELSVPNKTNVDLWQAIQDWERASESNDFLSRSSAIWRGLEHYVTATGTKLFTRAQIGRLRRDPPKWLTSDQRERYASTLAMLNNAPLMPRLQRDLERDHVPVSQEMAALQRSRSLRNRIEHGGIPTDADADDLRAATTLLGRLLVYRLSQPLGD